MLKRNLFFLFSLTLFAVASTLVCVFNYNPYQSGLPIFVDFYSSLFLSLTGVLGLTLYFFKLKFYKDKNIYRFFWPSIRQAALFSLGIDLLLFLKGLKILDWWVGGPLVIAIVLLELFFQTVSPNVKKIKKNTLE